MKYRVLLFTALFLSLNAQNNIVYVIPFPGFERNDVLFSLEERDGCTRPYYELRKALRILGYELKPIILNTPTLPHFHSLLCFTVPRYQSALHNLPFFTKKSLLFLWEPPTVSPMDYDPAYHRYFQKVYSIFDDMIDNQKYFKLFSPQPSLDMINNIPSFEEKKLCTLIACNKDSQHSLELYSQRLAAIHYFQHYKDHFDFYGVGWPTSMACYKGMIKTKSVVLKQYKFCICYENMRNQQGYITEKIFDCFVAGCVPVYWGADNITHYIPASCFIDRRQFNSDQELHHYLQTMSKEQYQTYVTNIQNFLASDAAALFSIEYFIDTVLKGIDIEYNPAIIFNQQQQEILQKAYRHISKLF